MKRWWRVLLWPALVSTALGCGAKVAADGGAGGDDSSTHWLSHCENDADCGGLECLCGVCSKACSTDNACDKLASDAVCEPLCENERPVCTRACDRDRQCPSGSCSGNVCTAREATRAGPTIETEPRPEACGATPAPSPEPVFLPPTPEPQPAPVVDPPSASLTVAELCQDPTSYLDSEFEIDLTGAIVERQQNTAMACFSPDGGTPECCNWRWVAYVLPCPDGDIVLTGSTEPYGHRPASTDGGPTVDDSYADINVTMGCQGIDCAPTCVPGSVHAIGSVQARLLPSEDGFVTPGEQFESFDGIAALDITKALDGGGDSCAAL